MIVLLGSSFTRAGHTNSISPEGADSYPKSFLHNLLYNELKIPVINMATPGTGAENYVDNFVYACKEFKPKLFLVETAADRSVMNFWFPSTKVNTETYQDWFTYGSSEAPDEYAYSKIFEHSRVSALTPKIQRHQLDKFKHSNLQAHSLETLLKKYVELIPYNYNDTLIRLRTVKIYNTLETLSELVNVPIIYYSYWSAEYLYSAEFTDTLSPDRYLNRKFDIKDGVLSWAAAKFNNNHLADSTHLNPQADTAFVKELLAPFISSYLNGQSQGSCGTLL
jgi:hypothetical protein